MSSLSGKVTVDEAPVSGGKVTFEKGDERITAVIFSDGSYNVAHIPQGSWKVIVTEPGPASDPKEKRAPVSIPAKYRDAKTTDLTYTSKEGDQTFNIELKKK